MMKKGMAAKKATVKRTSRLRSRAKIVASRPSTTTNRAWIYAASPTERLAKWKDDSAGKWCVFRHGDAIDEAWLAVRGAIEAGHLALAKVSTRLTSPMHGNTHVICVYSRDWRDDAAIAAARGVLRELGFTEELGYKRDIETAHGVYGTTDEWYRHA
jgi:Domain of unknown function (DUF1917)